MENIINSQGDTVRSFFNPKLNNLNKILLSILAISVILGSITGYTMSKKGVSSGVLSKLPTQSPKTALQDTRTFRDFAEGTLRARPASKNPGEYVEGSHMLARDGAYPVALTSSVIDLSQYEGKKVKVYGETQKALKEGWLMDVGRVEEIK